MSNALMIAISATLRPVPAASGISFVGACTPALGSTSGTQTLGLPAGAQADDIVVMAFTNDFSLDPVAIPDGAIVAVPRTTYKRATGGSSQECCFIGYLKKLTSDDITAGALTFNFATSNSSVLGAVYRNASIVLNGTPGSAGTGAPITTPATFDSPGTTTDVDGCMLVSWGIINPASIATTFTGPDGFTQNNAGNYASGMQWMGHTVQETAGDSGAQSYTDADNLYISAGYGAWTLALRPRKPSIALTYDLPATATIGVPYTGSITATLVDGATGPVTITAASLPDGVTAGTQVDNGDGSYTLPISGTPTTAQTANWTVGATNGTLSASASGSIVVSEASSAKPRVVQVAAGSVNATSLTLTLPAPPTPGNHLLLVSLEAHTEYTTTMASGFARISGMPQQSSSVGIDAWIKQVVTGDGASVTISRSSSHYMGWALLEVADSNGVVSGLVYNVTAGGFPIALTIPAGVSGALPIMLSGQYMNQLSVPLTPADWTRQADVPFFASAYVRSIVCTRDALSDGSAIEVSAADGNGGSNRPRAMAFLLGPAA